MSVLSQKVLIAQESASQSAKHHTDFHGFLCKRLPPLRSQHLVIFGQAELVLKLVCRLDAYLKKAGKFDACFCSAAFDNVEGNGFGSFGQLTLEVSETSLWKGLGGGANRDGVRVRSGVDVELSVILLAERSLGR